MTIQITGKNVDAGDAFQSYAGEKIRTLLQKYLGRESDGHVRLERERGLFRTTCSVKLPSGLLLEAHGDAGDAYGSVDAAAHRLETRIRRYKERIKDHSSSPARRRNEFEARDYIVGAGDEDLQGQDGENPLIIAEGQRNIGEMSVSDAVMHLDLSEAPFMIFKNAGHGGLNVVYRRPDGHIGWIDAELHTGGKSNGTSVQKAAQ